MNHTDKSIPREYLALKIKYCRKQLAELPTVKMHKQSKDGAVKIRLIVGSHRYDLSSENGAKFCAIKKEREEIERELQIYESIWEANFKGDVLSECEPHKVQRTLYTDSNNRVIMNKAYFDSLENDANRHHAKPKDYPFDGIYYRSAAEREIAIFYTEMGIPFKYEPAITIKGIPTAINPDFVIYIPELDNCKFHEHFGMKDSARYLKITNTKYYNYTNAGLVPELDVIFTHDVEEIPFDIRFVSAKINTAIYGTMIGTKQGPLS
jgi:hypothetical protein